MSDTKVSSIKKDSQHYQTNKQKELWNQIENIPELA